MPLDSSDPVDFVVIHVAEGDRSGQFILRRSTLVKHKIMSHHTIGGKRATRLYAPWVEHTVSSAQRAQKWQLDSFLGTTPEGSADVQRVRELFSS